jgi:hypothetical protein
MSAEVTIQRVLATTLLTPELVVVPEHGVSQEQLSALEARGIRLSPSLQRVLRRWDGIDLDVIRVHDISRIMENEGGGDCLFGSDPSGFLYMEAPDGSIVSIDTDGDGMTVVASSFDEFIDDLVFGARGAEFSGDEWLEELIAAGLVDLGDRISADQAATTSANRIRSIETVELEGDEEDDEDDEPVVTIMVALDIVDETSIKPFVAEVGRQVVQQMMISPPETEMLLITVIGPRTSTSFEDAWKEMLGKDAALLHLIKRLSVAEGVLGTAEGKVLAEFSLAPE